jgi:hypothetical protein
LVTEGGEDGDGRFHHLPAFDDSLLASFFAREVFSLLLGEELISPEMVEKILLWPHSGFNVHSKVRAKTKEEAEKVGKYMIRPLLSLERLSYEKPQGQVSYRYYQPPQAELCRRQAPSFVDRFAGTSDGCRGQR